jgi:hypothetical protein
MMRIQNQSQRWKGISSLFLDQSLVGIASVYFDDSLFLITRDSHAPPRVHYLLHDCFFNVQLQFFKIIYTNHSFVILYSSQVPESLQQLFQKYLSDLLFHSSMRHGDFIFCLRVRFWNRKWWWNFQTYKAERIERESFRLV